MEAVQSIWYSDGANQNDRYFSMNARLSDDISDTSKKMLYSAIKNGSSGVMILSSKELRFVYHSLEEPTPGHVCVLNTKVDLVTGVKVVRLLTIIKDGKYYRSTFTLNMLNA